MTNNCLAKQCLKDFFVRICFFHFDPEKQLDYKFSVSLDKAHLNKDSFCLQTIHGYIEAKIT